MAIQPLYQYSQELRRVSEPVTAFDDDLIQLIRDLFDTCEHCGGVGVAAPQIHVFKRVCVIDFIERRRFNGRDDENHERYALINPEISDCCGEQVGREGCLSLAGTRFHCNVKRPQELVCRYQDETGERHTIIAEGTLARVVSHEVDHMDGKLYFDRVSSLQRNMVLTKYRKAVKRHGENAARSH